MDDLEEDNDGFCQCSVNLHRKRNLQVVDDNSPPRKKQKNKKTTLKNKKKGRK